MGPASRPGHRPQPRATAPSRPPLGAPQALPGQATALWEPRGCAGAAAPPGGSAAAGLTWAEVQRPPHLGGSAAAASSPGPLSLSAGAGLGGTGRGERGCRGERRRGAVRAGVEVRGHRRWPETETLNKTPKGGIHATSGSSPLSP